MLKKQNKDCQEEDIEDTWLYLNLVLLLILIKVVVKNLKLEDVKEVEIVITYI